jgi:hypothetical protein
VKTAVRPGVRYVPPRRRSNLDKILVMVKYTITMSRARRLLHLKDYLPSGLLREISIYAVPASRNYPEGVKYSCYLGNPETGEKIIGYDIHPGKSHHRHVRGQETSYQFLGLEELLDDFAQDVQRVLEGKL